MPLINEDCNTIYGGLLLDSYFNIVISSVFFAVVQVFYTEFFSPLIANCRKKNEDNPAPVTIIARHVASKCEDIEIAGGSVSANTDDAVLASQTIVTVKVTPENDIVVVSLRREAATLTRYFRYQFVYTIVTFIYSLVSIKNSSHSWINYTDFYGFIMNANIPLAFISSSFAAVAFDNKLRKAIKTNVDTTAWWNLRVELITPMLHVSLATFLMMLPALLTHVLPGLILYIWIVIIVVIIGISFIGFLSLIYFGSMRAFTSEARKDIDRKSTVFLQFFLQIFLQILLTLFFQSLYNYAALFYSSNSGEYLDVISREYHLRSQTFCYYQQKDLQDGRNFFVYFDWI